MNSIYEEGICKDDRKPLEEDGCTTGVIQVFNNQHLGVKVLGNVRKRIFEPSKKWWIIQGPFRGSLKTK